MPWFNIFLNKKVILKIYKQLYDWALEDVERYEKFVKKQKKFFKELNKKKQAPAPFLYFFKKANI